MSETSLTTAVSDDIDTEHPVSEPPVSDQAGLDEVGTDETVEEAAATAACPHCGSEEPWGLASWCPRCGFYPALGTWTEANPQAPAGHEAERPKQVWELIPEWAWILMAGVLATGAISVLGRLSTAEGTWARTVWALVQCAVGLVLVAAAHGLAYMQAVMGSDKFGLLDFVMKPFAIWSVTLQKLPGSAWRIWIGSWGLSTAVLALAVVGGVRYSAIFDDWGVRKQATPNLVHAITEQARAEQAESASDNLEDAMKEFAGEADPNKLPAPEPMLESDCVIVGYTESQPGEGFSQLLLAALVKGRLQYVGTISEGIPESTRAEVDARLRQIRRERPFVKCPHNANWVAPVLMCRVAFKAWTEDQRLRLPEFRAWLADAR